MAAIQVYKCPCCGGAIVFDSTTQKMKCPFCDTGFEMATLASYDSELKCDQDDDMTWDTAAVEQWQGGGANGSYPYVCQSCGGEITCDENTAAAFCPFCGDPVIMTERASGTLRPDLVIPFQLDKGAAKTALKKHYEGKRLLPKVFKDQGHIDEIKGVYVPFWLFDASVQVDARYKATKVHRWSDDSYDYKETAFYSVSRRGILKFENVPVDGSTKMPDDLMDSIGPYDHSKAVSFQTAYLAGYLASKYDVSADQCALRANERIRKSAEDAINATVNGYESVTKEAGSIRSYDPKIRYALLPVWLLSTRWNGQDYLFAMNGQTGKLVGDLPVDKAACRKWLFGLTGIIGTALFAFSYLIYLI